MLCELFGGCSARTIGDESGEAIDDEAHLMVVAVAAGKGTAKARAGDLLAGGLIGKIAANLVRAFFEG